MDETHKIYYWEENDRSYWECQTCSSSGGGSMWRVYDPEEHAERVHKQVGITHLVTTNRRLEY